MFSPYSSNAIIANRSNTFPDSYVSKKRVLSEVKNYMPRQISRAWEIGEDRVNPGKTWALESLTLVSFMSVQI
jgi:hypothetical protein